ncbi:MAG: SET domain-containing protein [Parachlamydiales bacterium]|nr:SET domain-containing protein [Candidatus Acheromyda pituitae]
MTDHKEDIQQEKIIKNFGDILLKESTIGQFDDGIGAFANRDFKNGEVVIKWHLKALSEVEYENLSGYEKLNFCHQRNGILWLYPDPERHVNRYRNPNVASNFEKQANIALRDIKNGEELSIDEKTIEDF